jgi:electron transfer flavoprotein beta subunit
LFGRVAGVSSKESNNVKIAVLIKQVPDTWAERSIDISNGRVDRSASDAVLDEINERAIEVGLAHRDANKGTEVVLVSMGPASVVDALRKGLAMGADSAVHVLDETLAGADLSWTAHVLATVIASESIDLVIAGNESTDGRGGIIPAMVAARLGIAALTNLDEVRIETDRVAGTRVVDTGTMVAHAPLPAVISVTERSAEPRFPGFKGIMTAKKKPISVRSLSELGLDIATFETPRTIVLNVEKRAAREAGRKVVDEGTAAAQLVDFLTAGRLI